VCVDRPLLALDRPFTYRLDPGLGAGVGSLVQVPFHGKAVRGYLLGATDDVPARVLPVRKVVSPVRFFDDDMLALARWMSERYVAPLAAVLERLHPPRVASEEDRVSRGPPPPGRAAGVRAEPPALLHGYRGGPELLRAISEGEGAFLLRPAPEHEVELAVEAVTACVAAGRTALVLVPEAEPIPATAAALLGALGDRAALFLGGDRRERYRTWLEIKDGRQACVVGTRPAVFAPLRDLGLIWVSRESHAGHREDRSPSAHVRDVALARARLAGAVVVLSALCPSSEAVVAGATEVSPASRAWPPVEVVRPGPEGRAPRLVSALREARRAFLFSPLPGYGVARVCRACGEPAACAACGGVLRQEGGRVACAVCGRDGRCGACGAGDFGIARRGAERVEEWAGRLTDVPVRRVGPEGPAGAVPDGGGVAVGGMEAVNDAGPLGLDLVGILDADLAARRPGLAARERALAVWMEAAGWARPGGRVVVQATAPNDPMVQALVQGNPGRFHRAELPRRRQAGFPAGFPVFRVTGTAELPGELERLAPVALLVSGAEEEWVCLLTIRPEAVAAFGRRARELAERGVVARVDAEPHL
jgi:primosomal protein N' (replication factor Y) (superfamily II helicase)